MSINVYTLNMVKRIIPQTQWESLKLCAIFSCKGNFFFFSKEKKIDKEILASAL